MPDIAATELLAWALVAGGLTYWLLTSLGRRAPAAMVGAGLAALAVKSALIELI
jgi:hypothetical protein